MSFPNYKTKIQHHRFFWKRWISEEREKDGWEDLGIITGIDSVQNGKAITEIQICKVCNDKLYVGKEDKQVFKFCLRCLIKYK